VVACGPVRTVPWEGKKLELVVACGSLKGGRSDWLIEKATELNAYAFTPLLTHNSRVMGTSRSSAAAACDHARGAQTDAGRLQRWQRVAAAALKQSLRVHRMQLEQVWNVQDAVAAIAAGAPALLAMEGGMNVLEALHAIRQVHFHGYGRPVSAVSQQDKQHRDT
jgi:RsmE family RNA methyltransferase